MRIYARCSENPLVELAARELARRRLVDFATYTYPQYMPEPAHELIGNMLEKVERGEIKRLMIFAPPQHGKSELVSVRFPAWWLGRHPEEPVILCSYAASLAQTKSREARGVIEGPFFKSLFAVGTDPMSRAVDYWRLANHRGGMLAAGVGGPITGHGARVGIVDDPLENWEQAQSATIREKVWEWYRTTFRTRIWEGGAIVLIMTRWHEDDLAGRLLQDQGRDWTVVRMPAMAEGQVERDANNARLGLRAGEADPLGREVGVPLCPGRFSAEALEAIKRDVGSLGWSAEYQGCPILAAGNRIKREWFHIVERVPTGDKIVRVRYWDKASTEGGGKYSVGVLLALSVGRVCVEHVARGQWSTGKRRTMMQQTAMMDRDVYGDVKTYIEQEPGSSGVDSVQDEIKMLAGFAVYADRPTGDKDTRLEPFVAQAEAGNVDLVRGEWNQAYIDEMCAVPKGTVRDQADATAGAYNKASKFSRYARSAYAGMVQ